MENNKLQTPNLKQIPKDNIHISNKGDNQQAHEFWNFEF
jgi:hypothetical protein